MASLNILGIAVLVIGAFAQPPLQHVLEVTGVDECLEKNGMTLEDLTKESNDDGISKTVLCFYKCLGEANDVIDKDTGELNMENMSHVASELTKEELDQFKKCVTIKKVETCEDMQQIFECSPKSMQ